MLYEYYCDNKDCSAYGASEQRLLAVKDRDSQTCSVCCNQLKRGLWNPSHAKHISWEKWKV
jgi:hypothetical protein